MKTSVIRYRVADFLKQYPPFNELSPEHLLTLAASGRVVFHESDEYIYRKSQPRSPFLWVIQQGSVQIIDDTPHGEQLRDLLSEGDLLGTETTASTFSDSAKTASDVILYTLDAAKFVELAAANPRMERYLAAIGSGYNDDASASGFQKLEIKPVGRTSWLDTPGPPIDFLQSRLISLPTGASMRDAAIKMTQTATQWCAVLDDGRLPVGLLSDSDLCRSLANGAPPDTSMATIMQTPVAAASAGLSTGDYFTAMMRQRCRVLALTIDGTATAPLHGLLTDVDLALFAGQNPALLAESILASTGSPNRKLLLQLAARLQSNALASPSHVDLCAQMWTEFQNAALQSIIRQSELELEAEGFCKPSTPYCWLLFGRAGRSEAVVPFQPEVGLIYDDAANGFDADSAEYFPAVLEKVVSRLAECEVQVLVDGALDETIPACQSLASWTALFQARISDPIGNSVHRGRTLFDFQPLAGDFSLVSALKHSVAAALKQSGPFIPVMANDTLSNLPPLTFFHGLVVELDGAQRETLDVEATALGPITDAARVFALAAGDLDITNTLARLEQAALLMPAHAATMREAAQAFRVVIYQQAVATFAGQGNTIRPSSLGRYDQRLLKTAFDAIKRLLEVSSTVFEVAA